MPFACVFSGFYRFRGNSKSQHAADVYTGHSKEEDFRKSYRKHQDKIDRIAWAHLDANSYPDNLIWLGPDIDDVEKIAPSEPLWKKRLASLYIDIDDVGITSPNDKITENDAREIIHIVNVALKRIWEITEYWGHQIGTKGFMK
jgi:AbiV family abortive infection protein